MFDMYVNITIKNNTSILDKSLNFFVKDSGIVISLKITDLKYYMCLQRSISDFYGVKLLVKGSNGYTYIASLKVEDEYIKIPVGSLNGLITKEEGTFDCQLLIYNSEFELLALPPFKYTVEKLLSY